MIIKKSGITFMLSDLCESQLLVKKSQLKIVLFNFCLVVS